MVNEQMLADPKIVDFKYFIKSGQKIRIFFVTFDLKKHLSELQDIHLS